MGRPGFRIFWNQKGEIWDLPHSVRRKPITMQGVRPRSQPSLVGKYRHQDQKYWTLKSRQSCTSLYGSTRHTLHMETRSSFIGLLVHVIFTQKYLPQQQVFKARRFLDFIQRVSPLSPSPVELLILGYFLETLNSSLNLFQVHWNLCRVLAWQTNPDPPDQKLE